jgi:predicted nucleic acid-binding protein
MKIVVVDTNILFSAMRNRSSSIRRTLITRTDCLFITSNFLVVEIFKHKERILKKSQTTEAEVLIFLEQILSQVRFEHDKVISTLNFMRAYRLVKDVDEKDMHFVALTLEYDAELWTRDALLKAELKKKGFNKFFKEK